MRRRHDDRAERAEHRVGAVDHAIGHSESWLYGVLEAISTRAVALGIAVEADTAEVHRKPRRGETDIEAVSSDFVGSHRELQVLLHGRYSRREDIMVQEGRAAAMGYRHALRASRAFGARSLILTDSLAFVLASGKDDRAQSR